jgi:hypothetical protein
MKRTILILLCLTVIFSCTAGCSVKTPGQVEAELDSEFVLPIGTEAVIKGENLRIEFLEVTEDSRCPRNVECVWAGEAGYTLIISQDDNSEQVEITEPGAGGQVSYTWQDYEIHTSLEPYPQDPGDIEAGDYRLRMRVSKNPSAMSAEIIGEWEPTEGTISGGTIGVINGRTYLFLTTIMSGMPYATQLYVLDVSEPALPVAVSRTDAPFNTIIPSVQPVLSGTTLYLPFTDNKESGLWVMDVTDPIYPRETAILNVDYGLLDLAITDGLLCTATFMIGNLIFFDIADPANPRQLADAFSLSQKHYPVSHQKMAFGGSMLYVSDVYGLTIIDVADPSSPREVGFNANPDFIEQKPEIVTDIPESGMIRTRSLNDIMDGLFPSDVYLDLDILEHYAYVAASGHGLQVIDIADPELPVEVARLDTPGRVSRVSVSGDLACLLEMDYTEDSFHSAIRIADISDPLHPVIVDEIEGREGIPVFQWIITDGYYIYYQISNTVRVIDIYAE